MELSNEQLFINNQFVRDLAWIFQSTPLISSEHMSFEKDFSDDAWLKELDSNPEMLEAHLKNKNLRMLGPYFEGLWEFYLRFYPGKKLLAKNVQVFGDNKTLGEFDFIYFDELTQQYRHLEVAIKYYLGSTGMTETDSHESDSYETSSHDTTSMSTWIGPNTNDRLDRKFNKLVMHQSKLSQTAAGREALLKLGVKDIKSEICLLGYLFYPEHYPLDSPLNSQANHHRGRWLRISDLASFVHRSDYWSVLEKPHWLAPIVRESSALLSSKEVVERLTLLIEDKQHPILISGFSGSEAFAPCYASEQLVFVVPDNWPNKSSSG
ncbi:DUF1853 family protein [Aliikangiella coralliicola]|uniref:DUF1853 family protein n=1 Tax=Aliikangiella coralliicola TaxID=2592383 RepID=A0A545UJQ1_9GAMM|nr:DUF1853 family protein [Aliikangiella coralliicola]TQV89694.1 DUF1853 family protein [Aliikangiella coralliicola]